MKNTFEAVTLSAERIEQIAQDIASGVHGRNTFASKANRDAVFRRVRQLAPDVQWTRGSIRNQLLHPEYVTDAPEFARAQTGFGNTVYRSSWSALYSIYRRVSYGGF